MPIKKSSPPPSDRPLPHDEKAEAALLGAVLLDPASLMALGQQVKDTDFFNRANRNIFSVTTLLFREGTPIDLVTVTKKLQELGLLEEVGGPAYVAHLTDGVPKISNFGQYANIVHDHARRREFIGLCAAMQESAYEGRASAQKILERASQRVLSMMGADGDQGLPVTWKEAVVSAMGKIETSMNDPQNIMRWNCNIPDLDESTAGGRREEVWLLVGMTGHGKSIMAGQYATHGDFQGLKGLFLSAEMSNEAVVSREIAHSAEVPMYLLRRPELIRNKERVLSQLTQGAIKEANRNLMIVDRGLTAPRVLVLSEMVHFSQGLDFVIVDYDQLVVRSGMKAGDDQFAAQAQFIANCLDLAKRLKICIMVLCQPRKVPDEVARGQRIPRLEDIFGSSAIANAAHQVLWVMRKYQQRDMQVKYEREAFLHHLKARNDKPTTIRMEFDPELVLFKQAPRRDKDSVEEKTES